MTFPYNACGRCGEMKLTDELGFCVRCADALMRDAHVGDGPSLRDKLRDDPLGETPDWPSLKSEICRKIDYVAAAWEKLEPIELRDKIRRDLLLPNLALLAEFCAAIEEKDEDSTSTQRR